MKTKVAFLWQTRSMGMYSNSKFESLYQGIGHNNGNLAFKYAIENQIDDAISYLPWHSKPETLAKYDVIVIPCANQFGRHTDLGGLAANLRAAAKPVVAIGLGAQADDMSQDVEPTAGTIDWVQTIAASRKTSASNIYTRGPYTSQQLARFDVAGTTVGGCPSHFISPNTSLGAAIYKSWKNIKFPRSISVAAGHQSWIKTRTAEQQLISLMMDPMCFGQYVVQSMGDMIKISRGEFDTIEPSTLEKIRLHTVPHYSLEEFKNWCGNYAHSFYDVPAWMDSLRRFDLAVGPRYHGIQLAIQAEKMGLVLTIDSRTKELCEQTGVPNISVTDIADRPLTRATLKSRINFDPVAYDTFRAERAQNYASFLSDNGLTPSKQLTKIAESKNSA